MKRTHQLTPPVLALLAAAVLSLPSAAMACGGFFCFTMPIDQSAERILYVQEEGKTTVHIQISYTGDDDKFSWVLPLLSVPKLGIGSDSVFQVLEQGTAPRFSLTWQDKPDCHGFYACPEAALGGSDGTNGEGKGGGVQVLKQEKVGPYETVTLKSNSGEELIKWLTDNGYQQPKETTPLVDLYAKEGYVFLALKLQKDKSAGDIAPIVVIMEDEAAHPCLPIRLTRIATQPDMPIVAWALGKARAIPKNFLHVLINEATIDWLQPGSNYKSVVSKAVDQASGHAFVTEYAQPTSAFGLKFAQANWDTDKLAKITDAGKFLAQLLQDGYPRTTQMQGLIKKHVPKPAEFSAVTDQEFYNCIQCDGCSAKPCTDYKSAVALQPFDSVAFAKDLKELIVKPLNDVQSSLDQAKVLTRLYTTLSAAEMDKDPIFAFNPDLPMVSNLHTATAEPICKAGSKQAHQVKLTFADGHSTVQTVPDNANSCSFGLSASVGFGEGTGKVLDGGGQPALRIEVLDESGPALEIDQSVVDKVDAELNKAEYGKPSLSDEFKKGLPAVTWNPGPAIIDPIHNNADTSTCQAARAPSAPWWLLAGLLMLVGVTVLWRKRRA